VSAQLIFDLIANDKSGKTVDSFAGKVTGTIGGAFNKLSSTVGGEFGDVLGKVGSMIEGIGGKTKTTADKLGLVGGGVVGLGAAMSMFSSSNVQADKQLEAAFTGAGESIDDYRARIDETVKANQKFGKSDDDTKNALATLTEVLGDPTKALNDMGLVADYAAAKHSSLQDAADTLGKALGGGSTKAFTAYGVQIKTAADGTKDIDGAVAELSGKLQGQAAASVDTFAGKVGVLKTQAEDTAADFAAKLGPAVTIAGGALTGFSAVMQIASAVKTAHAVAAAAATAATQAESVATGEATVAQTGFNVAMLSNPVTWIVLGVVALIAAIVLLATHWDKVKEAGAAAWDWIKGAWSSAGEWFSGIGDHIAGIFTSLPDKLKTVGTTVANVLTWPIRTEFNGLADIYNDSIGKIHVTLPSWLGGASFSMPQMPHIPAFASGVTGFGGGLAWTGEDGPELAYHPAGTNVYPAGNAAPVQLRREDLDYLADRLAALMGVASRDAAVRTLKAALR